MKKRGPFTLISSKLIYENPWIRLREDKVVKPDKVRGIFGVITMKVGSSTLAVDNKKNVYLVEEYKYGIQNRSTEVVSGAIKKNETPLRAAKRELKEETGLTAKKWISLGKVNPFTTIVNSPNYMFLATNLRKTKNCLEGGEKIKLIKLPFFQAVKMVLTGKITHSASCVLILKAREHLKL